MESRLASIHHFICKRNCVTLLGRTRRIKGILLTTEVPQSRSCTNARSITIIIVITNVCVPLKWQAPDTESS